MRTKTCQQLRFQLLAHLYWRRGVDARLYQAPHQRPGHTQLRKGVCVYPLPSIAVILPPHMCVTAAPVRLPLLGASCQLCDCLQQVLLLALSQLLQLLFQGGHCCCWQLQPLLVDE